MIGPDKTQCDPDLLQKSLSDALTEQQEEVLARHLAECASCRDQLESFAGSRDDWARIETALRSERLPVDSPSVDAAASSSDNRFVADFAVNFLEPASDAGVLGRLDNIEIRAVIGHGGNGIVLKGFQAELNRLVAAKVMAPHLASSAAARRRFAREAQATAAIVHPSVMPILSVNSRGRLPFLVMPYVDCESLQQRIDRDGPLPVIDVLRIGVQVARGLAAAHAQGLVHRDVKPANILLEKGVDRVMLTDFGLARAIDDASLTRSGLIAGTPQYMSPEQARGDSVDTRSDLFSLGSVLYAISTGRPPFRAETSYGILRRVTDDQQRSLRDVNPEIPLWLETIVNRLLMKVPEHRFADADQLAELLEDCVAHVQQPTVHPLPPELGERPQATQMLVRRRTLIGGAVALCVLSLLVLMSGLPGPDARQVTPPVLQQKNARETTVSAAVSVDQDGTADTAELAESSDTEQDAWSGSADAGLLELTDEIDQLLNDVETEWNP